MHVKEPSKCGRPVRIARDAKRDASRQNLRSERDRSRGAVSELRVHPTRRSTVIGSPPHGDPVQALDQRGPIAVVAVDDRIGFPLADGDQPVGCHSLPDEIALDGVGPTLRELATSALLGVVAWVVFAWAGLDNALFWACVGGVLHLTVDR